MNKKEIVSLVADGVICKADLLHVIGTVVEIGVDRFVSDLLAKAALLRACAWVVCIALEAKYTMLATHGVSRV